VIKSRKLRWAGMWQVWREKRCYRVLVGKLRERDHLKGLSRDGRIILK
jgi:hypothetical protein